MANIGKLTAHIGMDTAGLKADAARAQGILGRFSVMGTRGIGAVAASVTKLGGLLATIGGGIAVIGALKKIITTGAEFEQTMTTVAGVMRATREEMDQLTEAARRMGETTEWTASQAGEALRFLGMAGFQADQAIAALPGTLDLATAGGLDLGRAADIASNALTAMQLPVEQLSRVNDVFVGTITRSNVNMEQMAEAFKYGAPVANAFGYSIEELAGMIGQLGNAGVQGSMAGTQLAMAIQKANDIAAEFGYTSSDLLDVLESMQAEGRTNADIMQLFGIRAGRAALILKDMIPTTRDFQDTLANTGGEAATLADKMRSTLGGSFKELKSVIESLSIDVFETFREDLKKAVEATTEWIRENKEKIIAFASDIIEVFKTIIRVVHTVGSVIAAMWGGLYDMLDDLKTVSADARDSLESDAEAMQQAFEPPDFEPWNLFMTALQTWGGNILTVIKAVSGAVMKTIGGMAWWLINDVIKNVFEALFKFGASVAALVRLDFRGALKHFKGIGKELYDVLKESQATGQAMIDAWQKSWNDMIEGIDLRSPTEILNERWAAEAARQIEEAKQKVLEFIYGEPTGGGNVIDRYKKVEIKTIGVTKAVDELAASYARLTKAAAAASTQISVYEDIISTTQLTNDELLDYFEAYKEARLRQIEAEAEQFMMLGVTASSVAAWVSGQIASIENDFKDLLTEGMPSDNLREIIATQIDLYREMIESGRLTARQLTEYFEKYKNARLQQIEIERQALLSLGIAAEVVADTVDKRIAEIDKAIKEMQEVLSQQTMSWGEKLAMRMRRTFEDILFDGLKGQFKSFYDYISRLTDIFLRQLSETIVQMIYKNSGSIFSWLGAGGGAEAAAVTPAPAGGGTNIPEFQMGGIVTQPQLAMIGEVPEAVIPLNKLRDPRFWERLVPGDHKEEQQPVIQQIFNIQTPDVPAFQATEKQIMARAALGLVRARSNL